MSLKSFMNAFAAPPRIGPQEARELIAAGEAVVIDVREAGEIAQSGKVQGALHIPGGALAAVADPGSPQYDPRLSQERTIIVYCASGGRSGAACKTLGQLGYTKVFNLGGFRDWAASGGAVER